MRNKPFNRHDLVSLIRTFTKKEMKRFSLYLRSDYFLKRNALNVLYENVIKYHPLYTHVNCTKESLYKVVYPELHYNGGTMRDLLSSLYEAATDFITIETFSNGKSKEYTRINELRERGLHKHAVKYLNNIFNGYSDYTDLDSENFLQKYNLQIESINLNMINRHQTSTKSVNKLLNEIKNAELYLLLFSIMEITANYSNFILIEERLLGNETDECMKKAIKEVHKSGLFKLIKEQNNYNFIVEVYSAMLDAFFKRGNIVKFEIYKDLVKKHSAKFSSNELSMHYSKLISCCILGIKYCRKSEYFDNELLSLYYTFLEQGFYKNNKTRFIPSNLYRAIILHAIKMNKLSWLMRVINKFVNDIQPADRGNMRNFAMAFYFYSSGRNGEALEAIGKLNITQFIFKYDIYNLKLRIFYEEKDLVAAMELINNYRQFLRNDKMMPTARKLFHRNFMKYSRRLIMISEGSRKFEAGLEIQKLQNENCVYKEWLIEKLSLLDTSHKNYLRTG